MARGVHCGLRVVETRWPFSMNDTDDPLIWLLDDDQAIRDSLRMLLECGGFRVRLFETGAALLAALPDQPRGCLLLDLDMRDMDGLAVLAALRARDIRIPAVVFTGRGDPALEATVVRAGAHCLLYKPVADGVLFAALRAAAGGAGSMRD